MSSDDQTVGQQQPPERPASNVDVDDGVKKERELSRKRLSSISTEPGDRYTESVEMLVIEAELACLEGKELDNPAKIPDYADGTAEAFAERLEQHDEDLVPAWTRPWEDGE